MATKTPNLGLNKSADGEFGWGAQLRQNQDILDQAVGALRASTPAGANVQIIPKASSVPLANTVGEIARGWMPQGLKRVSTNLPKDYALQTWSDALEDGNYNAYLTAAQNGLSAGWWYLDVQRHSNDTASSNWRTITAKSFGTSGSLPNQIYISTCSLGSWTPFRRVAVDEPLTWIAPTLVNGWVNYVALFSCRYAKDSSGTVFIKGLMKGGSNTTKTVIFTLPIGMRPTTIISYSSLTSGGSGRLDIDNNGSVSFVGADTHTGNATIWLSLTATFKAEQ